MDIEQIIGFLREADAVAIGTGMSKVEFFQGQTLIGATTSSPYAFAWSGVPVGVPMGLAAKAQPGGKDVYDVRSASERSAIDGTRYKDW